MARSAGRAPGACEVEPGAAMRPGRRRPRSLDRAPQASTLTRNAGRQAPPARLTFLLSLPMLAFVQRLINALLGWGSLRSRRAACADDRTEQSAARLLLCGAIGDAEYRNALEVLAARDAVANPLHVPHG